VGYLPNLNYVHHFHQILPTTKYLTDKKKKSKYPLLKKKKILKANLFDA